MEIQHDVSKIRVILTHRGMAKPSAAKIMNPNSPKAIVFL